MGLTLSLSLIWLADYRDKTTGRFFWDILDNREGGTKSPIHETRWWMDDN